MMKSVDVPPDHRSEYQQLLSGTLPSVIQTEGQNEEYLAQVTELLHRADSLSVAEREFLRLLTLLVEDFEEKNYVLPKASPLEVIAFLMDQHGLKQSDLTDVFSTRSIASEVLGGKRELSKAHIRRLSDRFHVSPELFF